jgi:RHS repeat-associated protein
MVMWGTARPEHGISAKAPRGLGAISVLCVVSRTGRLIERYAQHPLRDDYTPGVYPEPVVGSRRTIYSHGWYISDPARGPGGMDDDGDPARPSAPWGGPRGVDADDRDMVEDACGQGDAWDREDIDGDGIPSGYDDIGICETDSGLGYDEEAMDPLVMCPTLQSSRARSRCIGMQGAVEITAVLCDIGHQGLLHDREFGLIYNRARYRTPFGRWLARDFEGYLDGMNLYEYVGSNPVWYTDSSGRFADSEEEIGGADNATGKFDYNNTRRYFYTCGCGWIDKSHFGWKELYDAIVSQLQKRALRIGWRGQVPGLFINVGFLNYRGYEKYSEVPNFDEFTMRRIALRMAFLVSVQVEEAQFAAERGVYGPIPLAGYQRSRSGFSLEDLPTNFLGIYYAHLQSVNELPGRAGYAFADETAFFEYHCGPILKEEQSRCLYRRMTEAEKQQRVQYQSDPLRKLPDWHPVLFTAHCRDLGYAKCARTLRAHLFADYVGEGFVGTLFDSHAILLSGVSAGFKQNFLPWSD